MRPAGSILTGTVAAASGEFAGPTPNADFSLDAPESATKQFTYTPDARGTDTQGIAVTSNGGDHTIMLAGKGVGPIYADDSDNGVIDFGPQHRRSSGH